MEQWNAKKTEKLLREIRSWMNKNELMEKVDCTLLNQLGDAINIYYVAKIDVDCNGIIEQFNSGRAMNPALKIMEYQSKRIMALADRLGLSPRSRKMMKLGMEDGDASPLEQFLLANGD